MGEVTDFRVIKDGDFSGQNEIALTRSSFTESAGKRIYQASTTGNVGVIPADVWGWFPAESAKLISVAFSSNNPASQARVIDTSSRVRSQINLTTSSNTQYLIDFLIFIERRLERLWMGDAKDAKSASASGRNLFPIF